MSGMDGSVNVSLRGRVTRNLRDYRTYDGKRRSTAMQELGDDAEAIMVAEDTVQSIVGYLLMDLRSLNKSIDSLALDKLIERHAKSVRITVVGENGFSMKREITE